MVAKQQRTPSEIFGHGHLHIENTVGRQINKIENSTLKFGKNKKFFTKNVGYNAKTIIKLKIRSDEIIAQFCKKMKKCKVKK